MKILSFDTETTGLDPIKDEVIEFGGCLYDENKNLISEYSKLFKTKIKMSSEVINIHGITNEYLNANGVLFLDYCEELLGIMENADVYMGHNLDFDLRFMRSMFSKFGLTMPERPVIDTISIAYRYIPQSESKRSLVALCKWAHIPYETAHRAYEDAKAAIELMFAFSEKLDISINDFLDNTSSPALGCMHWGNDPFLSQFSGNRIAYEAFND